MKSIIGERRDVSLPVEVRNSGLTPTARQPEAHGGLRQRKRPQARNASVQAWISYYFLAPAPAESTVWVQFPLACGFGDPSGYPENAPFLSELEEALMTFDVLDKNTLVPVILRLALAGIFIYHGVDKVVGPNNELGAAWANQDGILQAKPSQGLRDHLANLPKEKQDAIKKILSEEDANPPPELPMALQYRVFQMAVAWGELIGGIALAIGLLTRLAAIGEIIIQVGAVYWVTWAQDFSFENGGGYSYNIILLASCLALVLQGGGPVSADYFLFRSHRAVPATALNQPEMVGRPVQPV
jgi:uncharacterized membrane protein YphA (DoxX/SURF4 family)